MRELKQSLVKKIAFATATAAKTTTTASNTTMTVYDKDDFNESSESEPLPVCPRVLKFYLCEW